MLNRQLTVIYGEPNELYMTFIWRKSRLICIYQIKAVPLHYCSKNHSCSKIMNMHVLLNRYTIVTEWYMQKTELLIIFYLLQDKTRVCQTFRQIATAVGVSIGSVHSTIARLTEQGYIVEQDNVRILRNRDTLIERWTWGYVEILKPKLLLCRFAFLTPQLRNQWNTITLPPSFLWGGEPAAALQDHYLQPAKWTIYTPVAPNLLITTGKIIPNPQGEISVYQQFWKQYEMPLLVIYADLLATKDDRCIEAAQHLKPLL